MAGFSHWDGPVKGVASDRVGSVAFDAELIKPAPSQALTFNGIAQGFATDLVADVLRDHCLTNTLVNIGEYRAMGGALALRASRSRPRIVRDADTDRRGRSHL